MLKVSKIKAKKAQVSEGLLCSEGINHSQSQSTPLLPSRKEQLKTVMTKQRWSRSAQTEEIELSELGLECDTQAKKFIAAETNSGHGLNDDIFGSSQQVEEEKEEEEYLSDSETEFYRAQKEQDDLEAAHMLLASYYEVQQPVFNEIVSQTCGFARNNRDKFPVLSHRQNNSNTQITNTTQQNTLNVTTNSIQN